MRDDVLSDATIALVHAQLVSLCGAACRSHNLPVAVAVAEAIPLEQILWGLLYAPPSCQRAYLEVLRETHFDDGETHAQRLDLYSSTLWAVVLRTCQLALPVDQRAPFSQSCALQGRGETWFASLCGENTDRPFAAFAEDDVDPPGAPASPAKLLRAGRPAHLIANPAPSTTRTAIQTVDAFLKRFLTAREYRGCKARDLAAAARPETAACFADAIERLGAAGDADPRALAACASVADAFLKERGGDVDAGIGTTSHDRRYAASMNRYASMRPRKATRRPSSLDRSPRALDDEDFGPATFVQALARHDAVASALGDEHRQLVRAFQEGGEILDTGALECLLEAQGWDLSRSEDGGSRYRRPGALRVFRSLKDVARVHFPAHLVIPEAGVVVDSWNRLQRRLVTFAAAFYRREEQQGAVAEMFDMMTAHVRSAARETPDAVPVSGTVGRRDRASRRVLGERTRAGHGRAR